MKKIFLSVFPTLFLLTAWPALAQSPSPGLSPYEEQRYGFDLSRVPRDPYRTEFNLEGYQARHYIPPEAAPPIRSGAAAPKRSNPASPGAAGARDSRLKSSSSKARDRYQTRAAWRNEQRRISERSRPSVPQAPLRPGNPNIMGTPGPGQPSFPSNR